MSKYRQKVVIANESFKLLWDPNSNDILMLLQRKREEIPQLRVVQGKAVESEFLHLQR